jgi:hypothetical protein
MNVKSVYFPFSRVDINYDDRLVSTHFTNFTKGVCVASREDNEQNRAEAAAEGYGTDAGDATDMVWRCLIEHELVHNFIPYVIWGTTSPALVTECGYSQPYHKRLYEESLVIAFQIYLNTGTIHDQLLPYAKNLPSWKESFREKTKHV